MKNTAVRKIGAQYWSRFAKKIPIALQLYGDGGTEGLPGAVSCAFGADLVGAIVHLADVALVRVTAVGKAPIGTVRFSSVRQQISRCRERSVRRVAGLSG